MKKRIFVLFISLIVSATAFLSGQNDSTKVARALIVGVEITGPIKGLINSDNINYEGYLSYRLNHKYYLVGELGYGEFKYDQYNYNYSASGGFIRIGTDINILKPSEKVGNHYAGIGLRYGFSVFSQETPWLEYDNYWGTTESSVPPSTVNGHFLQVSGGIKAELFTNIIIGWTMRVNLMIYQSAGKSNKPVYIPGMGSTDGGIQPEIAFHIAWRIPLEKK